MTNTLNLKTLEITIAKHFMFGPPNGWSLGWDRSRFYEVVLSAAAPHHVSTCTSFDYAFCNWYEIACPDNLDGGTWTLTIKISFIAPVYVLHWTHYSTSTHGKVEASPPPFHTQLESGVQSGLADAGLSELPSQWLDHVVQGIHLELSDPNNVTVGKCLFTDYE